MGCPCKWDDCTRTICLHGALAIRGLRAEGKHGLYGKHILRGDDVVFSGRAGEVWEWLANECAESARKEE